MSEFPFPWGILAANFLGSIDEKRRNERAAIEANLITENNKVWAAIEIEKMRLAAEKEKEEKMQRSAQTYEQYAWLRRLVFKELNRIKSQLKKTVQIYQKDNEKSFEAALRKINTDDFEFTESIGFISDYFFGFDKLFLDSQIMQINKLSDSLAKIIEDFASRKTLQ